jgi:hypothetical protein
LGSFLPSWIRIRIRIFCADLDPDTGAQTNADPCESGSGYRSGSETLHFSVLPVPAGGYVTHVGSYLKVKNPELDIYCRVCLFFKGTWVGTVPAVHEGTVRKAS